MVEHINGKEQRVDILTKELAKIKFTKMHKFLGLEDLLNQKLGVNIMYIPDLPLCTSRCIKDN